MDSLKWIEPNDRNEITGPANKCLAFIGALCTKYVNKMKLLTYNMILISVLLLFLYYVFQLSVVLQQKLVYPK